MAEKAEAILDRAWGNDVEPPVPQGLNERSAAQESLITFLRIDGNLLHIAASASAKMESCGTADRDEAQAWVGKLTSTEKNDLIVGIIVDPSWKTHREKLVQRFMKDRSNRGDGRVAATGRTAGKLMQEAEQRAKDQGRRRRKAS